MSKDNLKLLSDNAYLSGGSMEYVDALYEDYLMDPKSVPTDWQKLFQEMRGAQDVCHRPIEAAFMGENIKRTSGTVADSSDHEKQSRVADFINAYRSQGHHAAKLDPLNLAKRHKIPSLDLAYHGLNIQDRNSKFFAGDHFVPHTMTLSEIEQALIETYAGSIGIEYMHISDQAEVSWLQQRMEGNRGRGKFTPEQQQDLLKNLIASDGLERYLGTRYVGQKRFSLEGGDSLIPMLKHLIQLCGYANVKEIMIGMAHRGRLNVLVNVLGKAPEDLFQEFEGKIKHDMSGDVKYHMGYSSNVATESKKVVHLSLAFNPSHLEIIGPVVEGAVRSRLRKNGDIAKKEQVIPVIIHGDAAFAGQGVVMETFNFSQARGYATGGTIHIVINNQVGFTTSNPLDSRSTLYCTDVAKMVQAPILHVNGDDPEAVLFAVDLAFEFKMRFGRDVVIDLVCYRRHGHNEADEPMITQPTMYAAIKKMQPLRVYYADQLIKAGVVTEADVDKQIERYRDTLDSGKPVVSNLQTDCPGRKASDWSIYMNTPWRAAANTGLSPKNLAALSEQLLTLPKNFVLHPVVVKLMEDRAQMTQGKMPINWGYAETMAFAGLLAEGHGVRLSGQDCGRGTFAHRHAVLHNLQNGEVYVPLEEIAKNNAQSFAVIDSVLSEEAVLAFEYGYAGSEPESLIIWEAQFGDFANGAQVVIDQFISSGEQKWGRMSGLVLLLPHGYEGQGPEHSSARLERFMQLCAQENMQVCTPTTPAQIFHLLRRQVLRPYRKPLIIMSPKSLLRHKLAVSELSELTDGGFKVIIPEIQDLPLKNIRRLVICSGKVYYDLIQYRADKKLTDVAVVRVEQLYPFPDQELSALLKQYGAVTDIVWCQEEPKNQGAWLACQPMIKECLATGQKLTYVGRDSAAAPAVGSAILHATQQKKLIEEALQ
jgi:2-oxoglutarate dehydrogenase E1 component